jgi:hypothetical protein
MLCKFKNENEIKFNTILKNNYSKKIKNYQNPLSQLKPHPTWKKLKRLAVYQFFKRYFCFNIMTVLIPN